MQSSLMMVMEDHKTIGVVVVMVEMAMFVAEAVIMVVKVAMVANLVIRMRQVPMITRHHHLCLPEAAEVVAVVVVVVVVVVVAKPEEEAMIPDQVSRSRQFNSGAGMMTFDRSDWPKDSALHSLLSDEKNSTWLNKRDGLEDGSTLEAKVAVTAISNGMEIEWLNSLIVMASGVCAASAGVLIGGGGATAATLW
ncbi:hypothetical protein BHM03_00004053 [Ensete ventricosum]|nr:hypothetical protein BHM03_00004053 [Ensete ventricosum]